MPCSNFTSEIYVSCPQFIHCFCSNSSTPSGLFPASLLNIIFADSLDCSKKCKAEAYIVLGTLIGLLFLISFPTIKSNIWKSCCRPRSLHTGILEDTRPCDCPACRNRNQRSELKIIRPKGVKSTSRKDQNYKPI